jgi:hypothetical protein
VPSDVWWWRALVPSRVVVVSPAARRAVMCPDAEAGADPGQEGYLAGGVLVGEQAQDAGPGLAS